MGLGIPWLPLSLIGDLSKYGLWTGPPPLRVTYSVSCTNWWSYLKTPMFGVPWVSWHPSPALHVLI